MPLYLLVARAFSVSLHVFGIDRQRRTLASRFNRSARLWRGNRLGRKGLRQTTSMDSIGDPEGLVPNFSTSRFTIVLVGSAGAEGFTQSLTIHGPQIGEGSDLSIGVTRALPRSPNVIQRAKANPDAAA